MLYHNRHNTFDWTLLLQASTEETKGSPSSPPTQASSEDAAQLGPFDFRSPLDPGRPQLPTVEQPKQQDAGTSDPQRGTGPVSNADPVNGGHAQLEPQASAPHEDKEKQIRCGRALLERAMLGPPLPEGDANICSSGVGAAATVLCLLPWLQLCACLAVTGMRAPTPPLPPSYPPA